MMDENNEERAIVAVTCIIIGHAIKMRKKKRKQRRMWVKPWILQRDNFGAYNALISEFVLFEREDYRRFMRMNSETFRELLEGVNPYIKKRDFHEEAAIGGRKTCSDTSLPGNWRRLRKFKFFVQN